MIQLKPVTLGTLKVYQSTRFIPQLRAWIDIGAGYELGKIITTESGRALVLVLGDGCPCWYDYARVHCIHTYHPHTNTVEIHGEPQPCKQ